MHARQRYARLSSEAVLNRLRDAVNRRDQRLDELRLRLESAAQRCLRGPVQRLNLMSDRLRRQDVSVRITAAHHRLEGSTLRLRRAAVQTVESRQALLERTSGRLDALSPLAVLSRGYALVYLQGSDAGGKLLRSSADAVAGQTILARLAQGTLEAKITKTEVDEAEVMENSK